MIPFAKGELLLIFLSQIEKQIVKHQMLEDDIIILAQHILFKHLDA